MPEGKPVSGFRKFWGATDFSLFKLLGIGFLLFTTKNIWTNTSVYYLLNKNICFYTGKKKRSFFDWVFSYIYWTFLFLLYAYPHILCSRFKITFSCVSSCRKKNETSSHSHWNIFLVGYLFLNFEYSVLKYIDILSFYISKSISLSDSAFTHIFKESFSIVKSEMFTYIFF